MTGEKETAMKKWFVYGGVAASIVLIAFGVGSIVVGAFGFNEVRDKLAEENIAASADDPVAQELGIAGAKIDTGDEAKKFASMMREHTLAITDGRTYAEMGRFLDENGEETSDEAQAAKDPESGQPVANPVRDLWVTETALATALNTSFFAERVALFSIVMGVALLLTGIGFLVLTLGGARQVAVPQRSGETAASPAT
jgi:hypothetical protein